MESLGPMLARARTLHGWSQLRVAELLCAASGTATVTRHEVSRWEREERVPSGWWLGWLSLVLEVPVGKLAAAAGQTRRGRLAGVARPARAWDRLDRKEPSVPAAAEG